MCAKGLDAGEGFIVGAEARDGETVFTPERVVYLCWQAGDATDARAQSLGVYTCALGGKTYALGQDAVTVARETGREEDLVFPFRKGVPRGEEERAVATILSAVLGEPREARETVAYTVHGVPVDGSADFPGAGRTWNGMLAALGYSPMPVSRARSAIWGANATKFQRGEPCPAVGLVFGEIAVDIAVDSPEGLLEFSLLRGTDWIDQSVSRMKNLPPEEIGALRETRLNLEAVERTDPVLVTLEIYFEHQIHYTLQQIQAQLLKSGLSPSKGLEFVAAGPGAACPGFAAKLEKGLRKVRLPFVPARIVVPPEPLQVTAWGAMLKATAESGHANGKAPAPPARASAPAPRAAPAGAPGKKKISDLFRHVARKPEAPAAGPAAPPDKAPRPAAAAPAPAASAPAPARAPAPAPPAAPRPAPAAADDGGLRERIRHLEGRVAELEDRALGEDHEYVEQLRRAAGVVREKGAKGKEREPKAYFDLMVNRGASDLFLSAGAMPAIRVDGRVTPVSADILSQEFCISLCEALTGKIYPSMFLASRGLDLAIEMKGIGRFRANFFHQRGRLGGVFRHITERIPSFEELNLPAKTLMTLTAHQRGMILVTGVAGSGKSTTIASMIEHINQSASRHIITVEDPIEYVYTEKQSIIDQREVGLDTQDFMSALKSVVRQAPDVIFIGEMRDRETMEAAISAAETGHLVFSTLHTVNAQQTVERIITYFPPYQHNLIRMQLSMVLQGVLSQRLLPKKESKGRVPAVEIMLGTPTVRDLLLEGKTQELYSAIAQDVHWGNQTFNESIKGLYQAGIIGLEEALASADNPDELKLEIRGIQRGTRSSDLGLG